MQATQAFGSLPPAMAKELPPQAAGHHITKSAAEAIDVLGEDWGRQPTGEPDPLSQPLEEIFYDDPDCGSPSGGLGVIHEDAGRPQGASPEPVEERAMPNLDHLAGARFTMPDRPPRPAWPDEAAEGDHEEDEEALAVPVSTVHVWSGQAPMESKWSWPAPIDDDAARRNEVEALKAELKPALFDGLARALQSGALEQVFNELEYEAAVEEAAAVRAKYKPSLLSGAERALADGSLEEVLNEVASENAVEEERAVKSAYCRGLFDGLERQLDAGTLEQALAVALKEGEECESGGECCN